MAFNAPNGIGTIDTAFTSRLNVIRLIGDVLTELDVLRAGFDRGTATRTRLDNLRDEIDTVERKLVRTCIEENTTNFRESGAALKAVNINVRQTIKDVDKVAETLEALVKFLEAAQNIADLAP